MTGSGCLQRVLKGVNRLLSPIQLYRFASDLDLYCTRIPWPREHLFSCCGSNAIAISNNQLNIKYKSAAENDIYGLNFSI